MKETQIKQFFQMIQAGFNSIAKAVGVIKVEIPKVEVDMKEVVSEIGKTNILLKTMCEKEKEDENYEITLKIE